MDAGVRQWLSEWERAIRDRDFDAGQALFQARASGFGTVSERTRSRDDLFERQWRAVWPRTTDFTFDRRDLGISVSADPSASSARDREAGRGGSNSRKEGRIVQAMRAPGAYGR
jgi:hypothetical protein